MPRQRETLLTDQQSEKIKRFIPKAERPKRGRPNADDRRCSESIL
jgi:hypothetical protein